MVSNKNKDLISEALNSIKNELEFLNEMICCNMPKHCTFSKLSASRNLLIKRIISKIFQHYC